MPPTRRIELERRFPSMLCTGCTMKPAHHTLQHITISCADSRGARDLELDVDDVSEAYGMRCAEMV
eukprot:2194564-Rhodomonas_salina.5